MPKPTTLRMDPDLLARLDREVVKQAFPSRTWLIEQLAAKWLREVGHDDLETRVTL